MKFNIKDYKYSRIKTITKKKYVFIFSSSNMSSKNWLKIEQSIPTDIKLFKINTKLALILYSCSIYKKYNIIKGPLIMLYFKKYTKNSSKFLNLLTENSGMKLLLVKLNKIIYSSSVLNNLYDYKYINNVFAFNSIIQLTIKNLIISNFILLFQKIYNIK